MSLIKFLVQYVRAPRTVGAVAPSSKRLAEKMVGGIDFEKASCIVEYGPGTGVFTDKLIERKKPDTLLLVIEYNREFFRQLEEKYGKCANTVIINDSAENADGYLRKYNIEKADYVVSGLPFASLPKSVSDNILRKTAMILENGGLFITFQYTLLKKSFIAAYFKEIEIERVLLNVPPAYVFKCN